jgi:hypothetical protein
LIVVHDQVEFVASGEQGEFGLGRHHQAFLKLLSRDTLFKDYRLDAHDGFGEYMAPVILFSRPHVYEQYIRGPNAFHQLFGMYRGPDRHMWW